MILKNHFYLLAASAVLFIGCRASDVGTSNSSSDVFKTPTADLNPYSPKPANFRLSLTDAPKKDIKSVIVNIDHLEIMMSKGSKTGRMIVAKDLGPVDLLQYRNNVLLPILDVNVPNQVRAHQIRLVLKAEGNMVIRSDDSICPLQTPSAQKSGVKIIFGKPIVFDQNFAYSIVLDFDAEKSVVIKGNGGCLLKPVIKIKSATRIPGDELDNDDQDPTDDEDLTDGDDWSNDGDCEHDGWDDPSVIATKPAPEDGEEARICPVPTPTPDPTPSPTPIPGQDPSPTPTPGTGGDDFTPRELTSYFEGA